MYTDRTLLWLQSLSVLFGGVGVGALGHALWSLAIARRSENWFPVEAVVITSRLDVTTDQPEPGRVGEPAIDTYWPRIEFEYQFQGQTYHSDRIIFAQVNFPRQQAEELVARHPVGSRVAAYVNPGRPRQAVLEKGTQGEAKQHAVAFIVGGISAFAGLGLWFLAPHIASPRPSHFKHAAESLMLLLSKRLPLLKKILASLTLFTTLCCHSALAFDTFWHSAATSAAMKQLGFTDDAINAAQFGNFSGPDFFGPLYDTVLPKIGLGEAQVKVPPDRKQLIDFDQAVRNSNIRKAAIFLHFDNLQGLLDTNGKFDYIFNHLLENTKQTLRRAYGDSQLTEYQKKIAILMTLGASLHAVQDFYSHSDWVHNDFAKLGVPRVRMPWGKDRAPTWFELRQHYAALGKSPDAWGFRVKSGIYPPPACDKDKSPGARAKECQSHTRYNHDNSQLFYKGASQSFFHQHGPFPAHEGDQAAIAEHQLFAVNSAAGASMEWIRMLEQDPGAHAALDFVRGWKNKPQNPMLDHLAQSLATTLFLSCVASKWDGDHPPTRHAAQCQGVGVGADGSLVAGLTGGAHLLVGGMWAPLAVSFYNEYWATHLKFKILEQLTRDFGSPAYARYSFPASP